MEAKKIGQIDHSLSAIRGFQRVPVNGDGRCAFPGFVSTIAANQSVGKSPSPRALIGEKDALFLKPFPTFFHGG